MEFYSVLNLASLVAVAVFAISGALAAAEDGLDVLGFVLFAVIVGCGGGTLRDVLLDLPVFWILAPEVLYVCILSAVFTYIAASYMKKLSGVLEWADAIGMALFSVLGTIKAMETGASSLVAITMGVMTATFGSMIRDVILNREPLLLKPEIYVTASLSGSVLYVLLAHLPLPAHAAMLTAIVVAFVVRGGAIAFGWRLPKYRPR